jgi:UDP-N-acetylglucosamine 2-epimerase (non-hydrolysing)
MTVDPRPPKIVTIVGTRPELIRLSRTLPLFDRLFNHLLVHTGQNADPRLKDIFISELGLREPDVYFGVPLTSGAGMLADLLVKTEALLLREKPDALMLLGDTNSALACIVARKMGVPVFHLEAGNRCFDPESTEEVNRRIVDHTCDYNLAYTEAARRNLLREGLAPNRVYVTGSPLREVIDHFSPAIHGSGVLDALGLTPRRYIAASLHRQESVDNAGRMAGLLQALRDVHEMTGWPVVLSTHPRTRQRIEANGVTGDAAVRFLPPFGFFDWCRLQQQSACVVSDSGTVSEEAAMLGFSAVTPRKSMERPEAIDHGRVILSGIEPTQVTGAVRLALGLASAGKVAMPPEYQVTDFSRRVAMLVGSACRTNTSQLK